MANQTSANVLVAARRESSIGVQATATGAFQVRITDSPGLEFKRAPIRSQEKRSDLMQSPGRVGNKSVDGSYNTELSVGGVHPSFFEALMRSAWATSAVIGFASMTTVAIGTNTVTANAGDWVGSQGLRVGDIFTISGTTVSGNNNGRHPIIAVTSLTITTVTGAFTTLAATATGTLTRLPKLIATTTPTKYSYSVEQYDTDIDLSELFIGCRVVGARVSMKPNSPVTVQYTLMGLDRSALASGASPYFTSPTLTTGLTLIADDSVISYNGATVTTFTGFDLNFQITASGEPVIGSFVGPDIFDNDLAIDGTITGLRSDFSNLTLFDAETEFAIHVVLTELATAPKPCFAFCMTRAQISSLSAPVGGGDGAKIETKGVMIKPKVAATGYDATPVVISSSSSS